MKKSLNLLLCLWNGPTMVGSFYVQALKSLSEVWSVGPELGGKSDFPCRVGDPILPILEQLKGRVDVVVQFYSKPDYFPPDLFLVKIPKVWFLYDLHLHAKELSRSCCLFDLILVTDIPTRDRLRSLGVHHVEVLPFAVDDKVFYRPWDFRDRPYECGFSGSVSGHPQLKERAELLKHVANHFELRIEDRTLTGSEVADFYQDCRVVINQAVHGDINMRIMEVLMSGRPLVTPWVEGLEEVLVEGVHAMMYRNGDELVEKIAYLLAHPTEAEDMARRGQVYAMQHFSYECTSKKMLRLLRQHFELWKEIGPPSANEGQRKAAQFMYHWFRYPGDALQWLLKYTKFQGLSGVVVNLALHICIKIFRMVELVKNVRYFQRNE